MCNKLCKTEKVNLPGKEITLRNPRISDVKALQKFVNLLVEEDAPILVNKKTTLKEEREWLKDVLKRIKKNKLHGIFAFHRKEAVGNAEVRKGNWRQSHVGTIGISVRKNYRGVGLGTMLPKKAVEIAENDPEIKVLTLTYYEPNKAVAKKLYERVGFRTITKLPKRSLYKGEYVDEYVMDYPLKSKL